MPPRSLAPHLHVHDGGCGCGGPLLAGLAALVDLPADLHRRRPTRPAPPTGTVVLRGATVLPVDPAFSRAEAIAVRGDRILAVGSEDDVLARAGEDATVLDRPGATILPGFIEPHAHLLPTAMLRTWHDVGPFRFDTVDEALDHLASVVSTVEPSQWLTGRQFDPSLQAGPGQLTTDQLDRVSVDIPIVVTNASLHFAYANSAALAAAGITRDTPDIPHSPYGRHPDGTPNGVLVGQGAMLSVMAHNPSMGSLDVVEQARAVAQRASTVGVTTICDQGTGTLLGPDEVGLYRTLAEGDGLPTRLRYSVHDSRGQAFVDAGIGCGDGDDLIRATAWKIVSDGSNQGRTGHLREPYLGSDDAGIPYIDPDVLVETARTRAAEGWQVAIHANGDRAIDDALVALAAAVESAAAAGHGDRRHRIEHCSILHDEQIARIAELGLTPSFLIGHVHFWGQAFRDDIIGPERADLLDRTASSSAAGIRWTLHSDESVTPIEPLRCLHDAVTRELWREPGTVLTPSERVPVEAAIRAMTSDAAWQCHSEHEIGTLEEGKLADLVVLAEDPTQVDPRHLSDIEVLETWMGGVRRH
ncbi:amidohydrolase [Dermatobacter hominis]|uniref:amidohydrolase n=1 Tax=Dermatobacter hominis TaxID=2884263 RepID=UPI001D123E6C|nr:amidohydrolase [Dermatobacter hominis]UDY34501.1 amidohydrolase [Dermatobacter hominis]